MLYQTLTLHSLLLSVPYQVEDPEERLDFVKLFGRIFAQPNMPIEYR
jgi:hypothetical protein